jgi:hypothetical protein
MPEPRLPVEVWGMIIEYLPLYDQKSCLFVSRLFHDLAIRPIFSLIKVYLGWPFWNEDVVDDEVDWLKRRTLDLLDKLLSDKGFANLVKKLVVYHSRSLSMFFEPRE